MKTESEIIHRIKRLKYAADRIGCGFFNRINSVAATGNPLSMLSLQHQASELEWVIGKKVEVKKINWYKKAERMYRRKNKPN